jgi:pilus assembly protein Flp/PilA
MGLELFIYKKYSGSYVMKNLMVRFMNDESGATAIEYGLIAAGISVVIIGTVNSIGGKIGTAFTTIDTNL